MSAREYRKTGTLGGSRHGDTYQIHTLMLMYERAFSSEGCTDFRLATEMESAGKFDDAVLTWKEPDQTAKWLFVQVKHKQKGTINATSLFPSKEDEIVKGDFSLVKYLVSMWEIQHNSEFEGGSKQFVLYSNSAIDNSIKDWFDVVKLEVEGALEISGADLSRILGGRTQENNNNSNSPPKLAPLLDIPAPAKFLRLCVDEKQIELLLDYVNKDFDELADTLKMVFIEGKAEFQCSNILNRFRGALVQKVLVIKKRVVRFMPRFIENKRLEYGEGVLRERLIRNDSTSEQMESYSSSNENVVEMLTNKTHKHKADNRLPAYMDRTEAIGLLNRLTFAVSQPDNVALKKTIKADLQNLSRMQDPTVKECYTQLLYNTLQRMVHDWMDLKDSANYLRKSDLRKQFDALSQTIDSSKLDLSTEKFKGTMQNVRVRFVKTIDLTESIFPMVWISSTGQGLLLSLKLYQTFASKSYRYFSLTDLKIETVRTQMCETLCNTSAEQFIMLKDDAAQFEYFDELRAVISNNKQIKFILITNNWERGKIFLKEPSYSVIRDTDTIFDDFDQQTQEMLMQKTVVFQNTEISLSDFFAQGISKCLFTNDILENLITNDGIAFGVELPELERTCYIPRKISHSESIESTSQRNSASDFEMDEPIDGLESVIEYSEEQFIENFQSIFSDCKLVLLSAEPGMGKTTYWTKLAQLTKQRFPSSLVLHIKLLDCVGELQKVQKFDELDSVVEFLAKIVRMEKPFERSLLAAFLQDCDSYIFLDGFDELPYDTLTNALSLLRILQNHTFLFVSTRTHQKVVLEHAKNIQTKTFTLKPLSKREQLELLYSACEITQDDTVLVELIQRSVSKIHSNLTQIADKIIGVPLMVTMLAEIYRPYFERFRECADFSAIDETPLVSMNLLGLFEMFAYNSFRRQQIEKQDLNVKNPHTERMLDMRGYAFRGYIRLHSYLGLLMLVKQAKIKLIIRDEAELQMFHEQARLLDSTIVTKYVDDLPYFTHASFSEFFAAKCLFERFCSMGSKQTKEYFVKDETNRSFPKKLNVVDLFSLYCKVLRDYATVRKFFFLMVQSTETCWDNLDVLLRCMRPYPLQWACEENFEELVQRLLEEDETIVNQRMQQKRTALHISAAQGNLQICALLINHKARVNVVNASGQTPLHVAASGGFFEVVSLLIARKAYLDAVDRRLQTALHLAAQAGHIAAVRLLVKNSCNLDTLNKRNWNALHLAAFNGHVEVVQTLIENMSGPRCGAAQNWLMFLGHLIHKSPEIVCMLVKYDIRVNSDDTSHDETLSWAMRRNHVNIIRAMHESGIDVHRFDPQSLVCTYRLALRRHFFPMARFILEVQNGSCEVLDYPLHAAAEAGSLECVAIMLKKEAEVNALDSNGTTPLELAVKKGHHEVVQLLLENSPAINDFPLDIAISFTSNKHASARCVNQLLAHGANPSVTDCHGRTPLHNAAMRNCWWLIQTLLHHNDSLISTKDKSGRTPLHLAALHNSDAALAALLKYAKSQHPSGSFQKLVNQRDNVGRTALHECCSKGNVESVLELVDAAADVDCCTDKQQTPLHLAAIGGHWIVSLLLLKRNASRSLKDNDGKTYLDLANDNDRKEYIEKCQPYLQNPQMEFAL